MTAQHVLYWQQMHFSSSFFWAVFGSTMWSSAHCGYEARDPNITPQSKGKIFVWRCAALRVNLSPPCKFHNIREDILVSLFLVAQNYLVIFAFLAVFFFFGILLLFTSSNTSPVWKCETRAVCTMLHFTGNHNHLYCSYPTYDYIFQFMLCMLMYLRRVHKTYQDVFSKIN